MLARPPLRLVRRQDVPVLLGLGLATGLMTVGLLAAIDRIPLGTAVAIEFLGPLTVAAVRSHSRQALAWPALALVGVVLLTEPWHGHVDLVGVALAVGIVLVVVAGAAAQRTGTREPAKDAPLDPLGAQPCCNTPST